MELTTETTGSGPRRAALVHGLGGSGATWASLVDRIVATGEWTVTTVDLRGHGHSPRALSYRVDDFADDLVQTLPAGLELVAGHSLGGAVLYAAVDRLAPVHALYLDPGFGIGLPTRGWRARLFWAVPAVSFGAVAVGMKLRGTGPPPTDEAEQALQATARAQHDRAMTFGVFRDVAEHRVVPAPPAVPSTVLLSADGGSVVPAAMADDLARLGWDVRHLTSVHHGFWAEDADATWAAISDLF